MLWKYLLLTSQPGTLRPIGDFSFLGSWMLCLGLHKLHPAAPSLPDDSNPTISDLPPHSAGRRSLKGCAGRGGTQHTAGTATLQVSEPARPLSHLPEVTLLTLQPRLRHLRARRCSQPLESLSQGQEGMPGSFPWPGLTAPHGLGSKVRLSQSSGFKELPQTLWKQHYKNV